MTSIAATMFGVLIAARGLCQVRRKFENGVFPHMQKKFDRRKSSLWRNRNYLLLQGGQIVSFIGDQQQFIALPLLILALTGSAVQAGIAVSLSTIAVLVVSPLAGVLADKWNRKRIMMICAASRTFLILRLTL